MQTHYRPPGAAAWPGAEVRHLITLEAIGAEGSFRRAAERLGCVQSAVSQQMATLERAVGQPLLQRSGGRASAVLTDAGRDVLEHSRGIIAQLTAAHADLAALDRADPSATTVAIDRLLAPRVLPALLDAAARHDPTLRMHVRELGTDDDVEQLIGSGALDAVLGELPADAACVATEELLDDPFVLLVRADSPLARAAATPSARQLAELPLIGPWRAISAVPSEPIELTMSLRCASAATAMALVLSGLGGALLPRSSFGTLDPRIAAIDLGADLPVRRVGLARHRYRRVTGATERFASLARGVLRELTEPEAIIGDRALATAC